MGDKIMKIIIATMRVKEGRYNLQRDDMGFGYRFES